MPSILFATLMIEENPLAISLALAKSVTPTLPAATSTSSRVPTVIPKSEKISSIFSFNF